MPNVLVVTYQRTQVERRNKASGWTTEGLKSSVEKEEPVKETGTRESRKIRDLAKYGVMETKNRNYFKE